MALKAARDRADVRGQAVALLLLGMADLAAGDAVAAKADLEQSAAGMNALGDRLGAWMATWSLAEVARGEGHFDAAVAHAERTLELLSEAEASPQPFSLETLESLAEPMGLPALGPLLAHPALAKPVLLRLLEAISRDSYAAALIDADRLADAEAELTRAAAASQLFGGLFDASVATHLGDLRRRQWKLDAAEESYRRALAAVVDLPPMPFGDRWLEVGILGKLAEVALLDGRLDDALAWNERALGLIRSGGDLRREAAVLDERANLLLRGDRLAPAEKAFGEALAVAERSTDVYRQASIHADRGFLHLVGGNYQQAAADLETAIELFAKLGRPDLEASTWVMLAEVYTLLDLRGDARAAAERARALAAASGFRPARALSDLLTSAISGDGALTGDLDRSLQEVLDLPEASSLLLDADLLSLLRGMLGPAAGAAGTAPPPNLVAAESSTLPTIAAFAQFLRGRLAFQAGDLVAARQLWNRSLEKTSSKDLRAGFLAAIGVTYWREGKASEAARYFTQAVEALELAVDDLRVEEMLAGYLGSERRFYFDVLVHVLVQQGRLEEAFEVTERARARAFLQLVGNRRLRGSGTDGELVREAEALRMQVLDWERQALFALPEQRKRLLADSRQARDRQDEILLRLKVAAPEYAALTKVETLGLQALRAQLPPDTTLISYFVSPLGTHAWVLDATTFQHVSLPLDAAARQRAVCWAKGLGPRAGARGASRRDGACPEGPATAEELFGELIGPLVPSIHQPKIILVPHGVLHYVPFAALRNPQTGHYLIEDYTLGYAPSANALRFLRGKETPVTGAALVLGDPETRDADLVRLPAAAGEALAVARRLGTTPVLGAQAKESLLYRLDGKVDLLHLAAHGFYDPESPRFSRVALAPDDGEDGNLEVHEILAELDLSGVNLVVLSACQTAIGERSGGDEIVGLTRALLYAGTPAVISTLWDIDDEAAMVLMEELYRRLQAGASVADALREAQLTLLRSPLYHDPQFWAAFSLTGDPQGRWRQHD